MLFDENGYFDGDIPQKCIDDCTQPEHDASCIVQYWRKLLVFTVPRKQAIEYLDCYGVWDDLEEKTDDDLADIVLWLACVDIKENGEFIGLVT